MPDPAGAGAPIAYIERTHAYYRALGFGKPYAYACHGEAPFAPLRKPLAGCRIGLVVTASPLGKSAEPSSGEREAPYDAAAKFYTVWSADSADPPPLTIAHVAYDRANVPLTDPNIWFPLAAMRRAFRSGRIAGVAPRIHGVPTNRSQRTTRDIDAPEILRRCREDGADAVILVPNCPICHQAVAITARALEADGLPTIVMGCARDIVEQAGAPRFLFSDFPLGAACGRPHDQASQDATLEQALALLEQATTAPTTRRSPLRWSDEERWKADYCSLDGLTPADIARRRAAFDDGKAIARQRLQATRRG